MKRRTTTVHVIFVILFAPIFSVLQAQDVLLSQIGNSPLNLNPALTGAFEGNQRGGFNLRRQKGKVDHPYLQLSTAFDAKFRSQNGGFSPWSGGLVFNYERAGNTTSRLSEIGLSSSYQKRLSPKGKSHFSLGAQLGAMRRAYRAGELWLNNEFKPSQDGSPLLPSDETLGEKPQWMEKIAIGSNLHLQADSSRTAIDMGLALFHLTEPNQLFSQGVEARLQTRYSIYLMGSYELSRSFDLLFSATGQFQYPHEEFIFGLGGQYYFTKNQATDLALQAGLLYRPGDSPIPYGGARFGTWQVQISYDPTNSAPRELNERIGGPELSVIYIFWAKPETDFCKTCPTFM